MSKLYLSGDFGSGASCHSYRQREFKRVQGNTRVGGRHGGFGKDSDTKRKRSLKIFVLVVTHEKRKPVPLRLMKVSRINRALSGFSTHSYQVRRKSNDSLQGNIRIECLTNR